MMISITGKSHTQAKLQYERRDTVTVVSNPQSSNWVKYQQLESTWTQTKTTGRTQQFPVLYNSGQPGTESLIESEILKVSVKIHTHIYTDTHRRQTEKRERERARERKRTIRTQFALLSQ